MSDAIKKLHDYLAKSPSVVYPDDVLAYLPAIEDENAKLRERIHKLEMEGSDHFYRMAYAEDANRTLEAESAKLQDENARLRSELESVGIAAYLYGRSDLMTENAKLRNLATGLYRCWQGEGCEGCPMQDDGGWCVRDIRLRELGVEVDE